MDKSACHAEGAFVGVTDMNFHEMNVLECFCLSRGMLRTNGVCPGCGVSGCLGVFHSGALKKNVKSRIYCPQILCNENGHEEKKTYS